MGLGLCSDIAIIGPIDSSVNCGRNAGADLRSSPRNPLENPFFLFSPQRHPGTGFLGRGVIRRVRSTAAVRIQDAQDAMDNTLGIRSIATVATSAWADAAFSAGSVNGALDTIVLGTRCSPPEEWEVQLPVEGNCTAPNEAIFCIEDADCPAGTCENLFFCYERKDPNRPELGPALDSVAFIWQRDIVDNEPIPAGLPDIYRDPNTIPVWSTDPNNPTCPPICGTEYDHTTFEAEAITTLGALDRASGIQLGLDSLSGRRAGAGDMVALAATTTVAFINVGDIRCQMGGQDPNDLVLLGTCTSSRVPCDPDSGGICAPGETCEACGGTLIRAGDPLEASKGLNPQALPIGYDDLGIDALKLIENQRLGVLNSNPATVTVSIFVAATTGIVAATSTDNPPCNPSGDRCVLGETPGADPGGVGIGAGGTFAAGQVFAHGGENRSGGPVSWAPENRPGPSANSYVQPGTFAVGPDGFPGCMGNNSPRNNASDACLKRLARGQETGQQDPTSTQAKWGFCQGGTEGWLPEPAPPCQGQTVFFSCQFPYGNDFTATCGPKVLEFNTGADDPEILMPVVDEGLGVRDDGPFAPGTTVRFARPVIPNPSAPKPNIHLVGDGTLRDLDLLEGVDNTDVVFKTEVTSCPIDLVNGKPECFQLCGNGTLDTGEQCDDGNRQSCDGCSAICAVEVGPVCGDGVLNALCGEQCDDGNNDDGDGCTAACLDEFCGDGTVNDAPNEECDDGNNDDGDGCSANCLVTPLMGCLSPGGSGKSQLQIKDRDTDGPGPKDKIQWK
ncbi:MAG: DUF4215 domain-containing protein, partial [Gemmatimonadales bacterium]